MIYLLVLLQFLWITANGHSIHRPQIDKAPDVYKIVEDKNANTVAFVNPKSDQPTLREIVYYHLIEKPYGPTEEPVKVLEDHADIDNTGRHFTNSHGLPFLESVEKESVDESANIESKLQDIEDSPTADGKSLQQSPEEEMIYYYDEEEAFDPIDDGERKLAFTVPEVKRLEESEITLKVPQEVLVNDEITENVEENVTDFPVTTTVVEPAVEKRAKLARKLLFDLVRERYYKNNETQNNSSPTPLERRKRDINNMDIPDAPKLGPLNYDSLPPYVRSLISPEKPEFRKIDTESEGVDEIKQKMEAMIDRVTSEKGLNQFKPRTYGMNLTEDHGYVWNEMWSNPDIHFNVEASESIEDNEDVKPGGDKTPDSDDKAVSDEEEYLENVTEKNEQVNEEISEETTQGTQSEDIKDDSFEEKGRRRKNDKKKETTISELLENDEFWKWLTDWTSLYLEVLSENVKKMVQEEVTQQIKLESNKDNKDEAEEHAKEESNDKEDTSSKEDSTTDKNSEQEPDKTDDLGNKEIDVDNKLEIDEKDKDSDVLKKRKDKDDVKESNKDKETNQREYSKIQAQNLFGNSVGSEKVTNIFIFYPNDGNKLIDDVKNRTDDDVEAFVPNVTVDKRINVPDEDKKNDETDKNLDGKDKNEDSDEKEQNLEEDKTLGDKGQVLEEKHETLEEKHENKDDIDENENLDEKEQNLEEKDTTLDDKDQVLEEKHEKEEEKHENIDENDTDKTSAEKDEKFEASAELSDKDSDENEQNTPQDEKDKSIEVLDSKADIDKITHVKDVNDSSKNVETVTTENYLNQ